MSIGKALNSENDIFIENNSFKLVYKSDEVIQKVRSRLLFYYGEWFLEPDKGVPYFEKIFLKNININEVESILKKQIIETEGVKKLLEFFITYDKQKRKMKIEFKITTVHNDVIQSTVNL